MTNEIKTIIAPHYSSTMHTYTLSVRLNSHPFVTIKEGKKEDLEVIPASTIEEQIIRIWQKREHEENFMNSIQAKHPKKSICDEYGSIVVYNKNGSIFKTYEIPTP
jgi:hypothetical protein